jgi:hypothetical protein
MNKSKCKDLTTFLKKEKRKKEKIKKDLIGLYNIDIEMGYKNDYVTWLEDRYIELLSNFDGVNKQRISLLEEKYTKKEYQK